MKAYKYILLALMSLSMVRCSDLIEEPVGVLFPEGFFESVTDIETAVNGSFTHAINEQVWGRKLSVALMLRSDMMNLNSTQTRRVEMDELTTLANNGMLTEFWPRMYQGIAAANLAISGAAELVDADADLKNTVTAQAYFARAFYYFHLVRLFGAVPYIDTVASTPEELDALLAIPRTPVDDVYENIIADLEYAKTWLPNVQSTRAKPSKAAASAYLALVYLTRAGTDGLADFQLAFDEAEEIINNAGDYNLALDDNFQDLFNADRIDGATGPIFSLDYNGFEADDNAYDQIAPMIGIRGDDRNEGGGWSVGTPALSVYTSWDAADYRRAVSFDDEASIGGNIEPYTNFTVSGHEHAVNAPYCAKYMRYPGDIGRGNARATSHNYSMMRYAEVLLIAAEAGVEIGENAAAVGYLNQVRARARLGGETKTGADVSYTFPASTEPSDFVGTLTVEDVLEERRLELAFECKRWYDIVRRELGATVYGAGGFEGAITDFTPDDYLLPIPADERERNPNLTQNDGY